MDVTEKLVRALGKPDTVLFIGSGVSCSAGLPNWPDLLESYSTFCVGIGKDVAGANDHIRRGNLSEAASYLDAQLNPCERTQFFDQQKSLQDAQPGTLHDRIMAFGLTCFITTNYDELIEKSFAQANPGESLDVVTNDDKQLLARIQSNSAQNFVYKYHGDVSDTESIVLTSISYARIMHTLPIVSDTISTLLKSRSVVMLGMGLQDPDLDFILEQLTQRYGGTIENIFSINPNVDDIERGVIKNSKSIDVISYPSSNGDHSALEDVLASIYKKVSDMKEESEPRTSLSAEENQVHREFTPENISERIDLIAPDDALLRRKILSACHWNPLNSRDGLFEAVEKLKPDVDSESFERNYKWLAHEGILRFSSGIVFPVDKDFISAVAAQYMGDAEILLAGADDE